MEPGEADLHTLAGAYAMDAVAAADRAAFEQHLAGCGPCREETRGLREATARLATAAVVQPRPELRNQTLRAAAQIRQLPPVTSAAPAGRTARRKPRGLLPPASSAAPTGRTARRKPRGLLPRLALAAAAVLVAMVIVLAAMMDGAQHRLDQAQRRTHAIAAVLTARDVTMLTAKVSTGGTATVVMSHQRRALVFTAEGLRALPAGRHYELWLMGPAGHRPAGPLPSAGAGMAGPMVVAGLVAGDSVGLTMEPAAVPPQPTAPMIMQLGLGSR